MGCERPRIGAAGDTRPFASRIANRELASFAKRMGCERPRVGHAARLHLKSRAALGLQMQYAELRHVPGDNSRLCSDEGEGYRCAGSSLIALCSLLALGETAYAEWLLILEAGFGHVDVSLLKYLQWQHPSGK